MRTIEQELGVALLDRSRRPARPTLALLGQAEALRDVASRLRRMSGDLAGARRITIACQHALSVSLALELARRVMAAAPDVSVRLRSANRDECLALLMTRQASFVAAYETDALPVGPGEEFVEKIRLQSEPLIPIAAPGSRAAAWLDHPDEPLPIVAYPSDVFLGMVMDHEILPAVSARVPVRRAIETALTLAARELARAGLAAAWLPQSLARQDLAAGRLVPLPGGFPSCPMSLVAVRFRASLSRSEAAAWRALSASG